MIDNKLPDVMDISSKSKEERIIHYRKFFAELRLNRLYLHILILDFFQDFDNDKYNKFHKELSRYIKFFEKTENWLKDLKELGIYDEFKEQCGLEIQAIKQIIQSYEGKMRNSSGTSSNQFDCS